MPHPRGRCPVLQPGTRSDSQGFTRCLVGPEVKSQSYDLTEGASDRYWRLVTVKVASSSSSSQTDTGTWRSKGVAKSHPEPGTCPPPSPSPCSGPWGGGSSPVKAPDSTSEYEGWGELETPGLPHWGPDSPSAPQVASGPGGAEGVAVGVRRERCPLDPGGYCSPFPPELSPQHRRETRCSGYEREAREKEREREAETSAHPKPHAPPPAQEPAKPREVALPRRLP